MPSTPERLIEIATRHASHIERVKSHNVGQYEGFLQKMAADVRKRLSGIDEFGSLTPNQLRRLQGHIQGDLQTIYTEVAGVFKTQARDLAVYEAEFEIKSLNQIIDHSFSLPGKQQLYSAVFATPLTSITGPAKGKLLDSFLKDWSTSTIEGIEGAITAGYYQGQTTTSIMREIIGTKKLNYTDGNLARVWRNLEGVVRTGLQHSANMARQETWKENADIIKGVMWISALDRRTSTLCRSLDRETFPLNEGPRPPAHPNCRSTTTARLDDRFAFLEKDATRAVRDPQTGKVGRIDADESYYSWLKKQPQSVQDSIIGPARGKLLRDGGITAERFSELQIGRNFEPLTLKQMKQLEPVAFTNAGLGNLYDPVKVAPAVPVQPQFKASFVDLKEKSSVLKEIQGVKGTNRGNYLYSAIERADKAKKTLIIRNENGNIVSAANLIKQKDAVDVNILGSIEKGGGKAAISEASKYSLEIGKGGAVELTPLRDSSTIGFYINTGFEDHPSKMGKFLLTPEMAKDMGYIK